MITSIPDSFAPMELRRQIDGIRSEIKKISQESMESQPEKRRRQFSGLSEEGFFDKLPDDLIEEILHRLPLCFVFQARCVSKGWLCITTSPYFIGLFERHHNPSEKDHPVGLLLQEPLINNKKQFVICSGVPEFNCSGFSLEFLPGLRSRRYDSIIVVGSCDDLLLCCNKPWTPSNYFIVNSVTREWVALPPILRLYDTVLAGFVCDPTSILEAKKGANLRYRVVRIPVSKKPETELNVEIFSSENGQWNEYAMTCATGRETKLWSKRAVACNGSLYWKFKSHGEKIMALDPFNPGKKEFVVIEYPQDSFDLELKTEHLGIHRGKLRMSQTLRAVDELYEPSRLHIWELEEGKGGTEWRSVEEASLATIVAANSSYAQLIRSSHGCRHRSWITLAVHPMDENIIYFGCTLLNKIICCNLKTSSLEIVCDYNLNKWYCDHGAAFLLVLPWWPTPIPALPKL